MLSNDATIQNIKHEILYEVAKLAYAGRFEEEKDELAYKMFPGPKARFRCCVYIKKEKLQDSESALPKANVQQKVTIRVPIT